MIKNRSFESELTKKLASKHNPKKFLKSQKETKITMIPSGVVTFLEGRNKEKYETFFGISLPKIKIHRTEESILTSKAYHAYSYAQGNNIYLGKDVKPIDTVEGQTVIAHEITHILQQKYLDMSSAKEMVDPSVELERKAQVVEDRVRVSRGIEESSGDYFKKWDVLPERSYQARVNNTSKFVNSKVVQRLGFDINWGDVGSSLVGATVNQAKNVGGALSEAGSTALNGVTSVGKFAASGYTGVVAEGADLLGYEDTADNFRDATNTLQKSAVYDLNEASSHLSKSGKYGTNFLGSVVGNQKVFSDTEIRKTNGIVEELNPSWKKNDKYNKTLTEFGNQAIGAGLGGVKNLTGDLFTMKYGSWQYKSAEKYTNFMGGMGSDLQDFDETYLQQNILTETLSNSVKGAVNSAIIKPGQDLAKNLDEGKFIETGMGLVENANIKTIAMNTTSGSLDGNISTLQSHNIISEEQAEKFKVGKDTALEMTKLAFDIKNAKTKKGIANKRTNTLNQNIKNGKYTKNRVKGLFTVSENAVKNANNEILKSSIGLFTEGSKGFDNYGGVKEDSQVSKNFQFLDTLVDNKISYKNLGSIDKIGLMNSESKPIQRLSLKGTWESTKNMGNALAHSAGVVAEGVSSVAKLSASGYTGIVSAGADALGYESVSKKYGKVTKNLQSSASNDLNDATRHFAQSGKYGNNAITQLVDDRDMFSHRNIDNTVGARDLHYGRNKHNKKLNSEAEALLLKWQRLPDSKAIYHRMGEGNENNRKYVSPNGHSEAVFYGKNGVGKEGTPINSAENDATYNYYSPNGISAIGHVATDVLPYYIWGNSKQDSTKFHERITASYEGKNNPIQRKILNRYQNPVQRWSLRGAWNSVTNTASSIGNSVINGVSSAGKSLSDTVGTAVDGIGHGAKWVDNKFKDGLSYIGDGAKKLGTNIANKWNNSSIGQGINQGVKDGFNYVKSSDLGQYIGDKYQNLDIAGNKYVQSAKYAAFGLLDTATAIGKGALAVGTAATGVGAVTFGTAAGLDVNDAYKNFKNSFKLATADTKGKTKQERVNLFDSTTAQTDGIIGDLGDIANSVGVNSVGGRLKNVDNSVSDSVMLRTLQVGTDLFIPSGITKQALKHGRVVSKFAKVSNKTVKQINKFDAIKPLSRNLPEDVMQFATKQKKLYKRTKNVKLKGKQKKLYNEQREIAKLLKNPEKTNYGLLDKMMEKSKNSTLKQKNYLDRNIKEGLKQSRPSFHENIKGFGKSLFEHATPFFLRETRDVMKAPSLLGITSAVKDYKAFTELDETARRVGERFETGSIVQNPIEPQNDVNISTPKYANSDRNSSDIDKVNVTKNLKSNANISDSLDELSIKMFMRLKSEIGLEYARVGR